MRNKMTAWLVAATLIFGGLGVWALWTAKLSKQNTNLALQLEAERQRNFAELVGHVQSMQGLLGKGLAAGSTRQNALYMGEVYRRASLASANFTALPLPGPIGANTGKFLNQVGDFAYSIARNEAAGRSMEPKQREELARLQTAAASLSNELQNVGREAAKKNYRWVRSGVKFSDLFTGWRPPGKRPAARGGTAPRGGAQPAKSMLPGGLEKIGPQMDRMPVMVYDGPFSDHLEKRTPAMTGPTVGEAVARTRALSFVPNAAGYTVLETVKRSSTPPVFTVRLVPPGDSKKPAVTADITQAGGHLVSFVNARPAGPAKLNLEKARDIGRAYLEQHGFANMVPTYGEAVDGFATVQYVLQQRGVYVYPDQIKVRVALDTGEVVGVDARPYLMSHRDRGALEAPAVSQAQAAKALNPNLKVERVRLALIPSEAGDNEVLAYEFLGTTGTETYLVYVNAKTGNEERILQMLFTKTGTLAL